MQNQKLLIVDDDADTRTVLHSFLSTLGFDCSEAESVKTSLEKIHNERPGIIVIDLKLPDGDGFQVIREARKALPFVQPILITGFGDSETVITALREGVVDYIKKPFDRKALELALGLAREKIIEYQKSVPYPVILLAEDDEDTRKILSRSLHKESWEVVMAKDGEEALSIFKERKIDLVVMDIKMPKKDGLAVLHEMRQLSDDFEAIMVTGYGNEESIIRALKDGAANFVRKPIDLDELELFMEKALEGLVMKRALKYRKRELELAQNIITRITTTEGMVIDFPVDGKILSHGILLKLLDSLPIGLVLVNRKKEICYVNKPFAWTTQAELGTIDRSFVNKFVKVGIRNLSYEQLLSTLDNMFTKKEGAIETIKAGEWAYIVLVRLRMVHDKESEDLILLAVRGERAQANA